MNVPNAHAANVPERKLSSYLLLHNHPQNKGKATFYELVGFTTGNAHKLREALLWHIVNNDVVKVEQTEHGVRYVVEGPMPCANGKSYPIRSVWFISKGETVPNLVTAYPN